MRKRRGWKFTAGIDDAQSECGLDGRDWDVIFANDDQMAPAEFAGQLQSLVQRVTDLRA